MLYHRLYNFTGVLKVLEPDKPSRKRFQRLLLELYLVHAQLDTGFIDRDPLDGGYH